MIFINYHKIQFNVQDFKGIHSSVACNDVRKVISCLNRSVVFQSIFFPEEENIVHFITLLSHSVSPNTECSYNGYWLMPAHLIATGNNMFYKRNDKKWTKYYIFHHDCIDRTSTRREINKKVHWWYSRVVCPKTGNGWPLLWLQVSSNHIII